MGGVRVDTPEAVSNPKPDGDDFLLPLPCGLSMAFRIIFIPERGHLSDFKTTFGTNAKKVNIGDDVYVSSDFNGKHEDYISSSLSISDLPPKYRDVADKIRASFTYDDYNRQLYLIGKYELSVGQYEAVMNGNCALNNKSSYPAVDISWYDAVAFTEKLMTHVLRNNPDALPFSPDDPDLVGIVRLPTEEEWEFAARGGHMTDSDQLAVNDFFPMDEDSGLADYAIYDDEVNPPPTGPNRIGTRLPNQAGLHDTIGNVDEMTMSNYHMVFLDREHGSNGGFSRKGGGFRDRIPNIYSGARREALFFFKDGPGRYTDLGVRFVISSANLGSPAKEAALSDEYAKLKESNEHFEVTEGIDVKEQIRFLRYLTERETEEKFRNKYAELIQQLETMENEGIAAVEFEKTSVRGKINALINRLMLLRNTRVLLNLHDYKLEILSNDIEARTSGRLKPAPDASQTEKKTRQNEINALKKEIQKVGESRKDFESSYALMRENYNALLSEIIAREDLIDDQIVMVLQDIKGDSFMSRELRKNLATVKDNIDFVSNGGNPADIPREKLEDFSREG
ncbi:MAG: SUMF1/EgtB/PvdO family nonheme iron enzyme [Deltaproteobacteria bacterium]|nr:SUMF1/EgtB/PvdO family nonheme iron enzyme [Deltaproteobacteria bacterium]